MGDDRCSRYGRISSTRRNSRICQGSYWFETFAMRFYQYGVSAELFGRIGGVLDRIRKSTVAGFFQITDHRIMVEQGNRSRRELRIGNQRMRPEKSATSVVGRRKDEIRGMRIHKRGGMLREGRGFSR